MKKTIIGWTVGLVSLCATLTSHGALNVAVWNFDNAWTGGGNTASIGYSTIYAPASAATLAATGSSRTTANRSLLGGTDYYLDFLAGNGPTRRLNGSAFILKITAAQTLSDFTIQYQARTSTGASGAPVNSWQYSTDQGTSWHTPATTVNVTAGTTFNTYSVNFATAAVAQNAQIWFRDAVSGATANRGTADFNNITVTAVPEPVNVALGAFGLCLVGVGAGRRYFAKAKARA